MNKLIIFLCLLLTTKLLLAQTGLKIGASFNYAPSTLINASKPHEETGLDFNFKLKNSMGAQLDFSYFIKPNWSITASVGYLQKGARFADENADYLPRYLFSYLDFYAGTAYYFKPDQKFSPFVSASLSQHNLLNASFKNSFEGTNIQSNIRKTDIGLLMTAGAGYKLSEKHSLQFSLFYNHGFQNIFYGTYKENGLKAYNSAFGIRVGYYFKVNASNKSN